MVLREGVRGWVVGAGGKYYRVLTGQFEPVLYLSTLAHPPLNDVPVVLCTNRRRLKKNSYEKAHACTVTTIVVIPCTIYSHQAPST